MLEHSDYFGLEKRIERQRAPLLIDSNDFGCAFNLRMKNKIEHV
jgi:hypothetical protein